MREVSEYTTWKWTWYVTYHSLQFNIILLLVLV